MRIRSTKPEFWRSKRIASVNWEARLVLKGLESYVDDNGVGKYDMELIASDVFPRDLSRNPRDTLARLSETISHLHQAGLLWLYEAEGTPLLYISWWEEIQRIDKPGRGRLPRPDGTMDYKSSIIRESVARPRESVAPGTGEQRNRGTEEQRIKDLPDAEASGVNASRRNGANGHTDGYPTAFEDWWQHYPRRTGKRKAFTAWKSALKRASQDQLIEGAQRYAADPNRTDQYTKYPEGWLNRDGWLDEPLPNVNSPNGNGNGIGKPTQNALETRRLGQELIRELHGDQP